MHENMNEKELEQLDGHIVGVLNREIGKFLRKQVWFMAVSLVTVAMAWAYVQFQVVQNTQALANNHTFTHSDGQLLQVQIDELKKNDQRIEGWLVRVETKLDIALRD